MKKKAKELEKESGETDPKLVVPALARVDNRAYKPGKISPPLVIHKYNFKRPCLL